MQSNTQPVSDQSEMICEECKHCLEVLQIVLDGEASPADSARVQAHIQNCDHCLECYEVDKTLRETLRIKIQKKSLPSDLMAAIQNKIGSLNSGV